MCAEEAALLVRFVVKASRQLLVSSRPKRREDFNMSHVCKNRFPLENHHISGFSHFHGPYVSSSQRIDQASTAAGLHCVFVFHVAARRNPTCRKPTGS